MIADSLSDSLLVPQTLVRPRSFAGLMTLYESNFIWLRRLVPALETLAGRHVSTVPGDCDLHLEVLSRSRYTCGLRLTYLFDDAHGEIADPDLLLRVYFDGRLVEARGGAEEHRHEMLRRIASQHRGELDRRWRRNMMLNKWLDYCVEQGHRLGPRGA